MNILQNKWSRQFGFTFVVLFISVIAVDHTYGADSVRGVVYIAPHVHGHVKKLLGKRHQLIPVQINSTPNFQLVDTIHGVVLGGEDLNDPRIAQLAQTVYAMGLTVAMVDANAEQAEKLRLLVGRDYPILPEGDITDSVNTPLVAIREEGSSNCCKALLRRTHVLNAAHKDADGRTANWLDAAFQKWPVAAPANPSGDVQNDLTQLANSVLTDMWVTNKEGTALQVLNQAWAARSFASNVDYYYILQTVDLANSKQGSPELNKDVTVTINQLLDPISIAPVIVQYAPGTTQNATTYTSGVSFTVGATAGYNAGNILTAAANVTISNSTSTTVAPTQIKYQGSPAAGMPVWKTATKDDHLNGKSYRYVQNWIWAVPFDAYASGQTSISYSTFMTESIFHEKAVSWGDTEELVQSLALALVSAVPLPFNQTQLAPPTVASISSSSVKPGDAITVTGTNFYLLNAVLIGGNPVPSSNYEVVNSDTTLRVIVPANQPVGQNQSIVINTDEGLSNSNIDLSVE